MISERCFRARDEKGVMVSSGRKVVKRVVEGLRGLTIGARAL